MDRQNINRVLTYSGGLLGGVWLGNHLVRLINRWVGLQPGLRIRISFIASTGVAGASLTLWYSHLINNADVFFQHALVGLVTPIIALYAASESNL